LHLVFTDALAIVLASLAAGLVLAEPKAATVRLVVDYGDGVEVHFTGLPWREGMTVLDALSAAQTHRHGISFAHRGAGSSAMITKIGDLKNEGNGKNWLYSVNGKKAEQSTGSYKLKPQDTILWKFEVYEYNP
jgi:hypothetical protein